MSKCVVVAALAGALALAGVLVAGEARADPGGPMVMAQAQDGAVESAVGRAAERAARRAARREARQAAQGEDDQGGGRNEARWTLTADGLGPLNAGASYGGEFGWLSRRFDVEETTVDAGGTRLPAHTFANKKGKVLIEAVFAAEDGPLDEIRIIGGKFGNSEGHAMRQPFSEIFPNGAGDGCGPGTGAFTGMVVCWEPGAPNLGLVFGRPNNPFGAGEMPRAKRLAKMGVRQLIWRAPAGAADADAPAGAAAAGAKQAGAGGGSRIGAAPADTIETSDTMGRRRAHGIAAADGTAADADPLDRDAMDADLADADAMDADPMDADAMDADAMDGDLADGDATDADAEAMDGDLADGDAMDGDTEAMDDGLDGADGDSADGAGATGAVRLAEAAPGGGRPADPASRSAAASLGAIRTTELLRTTTTVLGAPLLLPRQSMADFEVRSVMVELDPGADTGWHEHTVPTYAHILAGEIEVTYRTGRGAERRLYRAGDTFMEAEGVVHRGRVAAGGDGVRLIEVIMAAPEIETSIAVTN